MNGISRKKNFVLLPFTTVIQKAKLNTNRKTGDYRWRSFFSLEPAPITNGGQAKKKRKLIE
jgi:hypothetical protein